MPKEEKEKGFVFIPVFLMGVQTYRNPRLVKVFYKLGYIENFGTGIPRIRGQYASSEEKPLFESSENFFFVRLPNLNAKNKAGDDEIKDEIKRISATLDWPYSAPLPKGQESRRRGRF